MCRNKDVGEILKKGYAEEKAENRRMLLIILTSIRFLGRQGLAFRGHYKTGDDICERGETDSNFIQLLKTRAEDNPSLLNLMKKSQSKFTCPDIQNEVLSIMALMILRKIASEQSGKLYTIMVGETTDLSNTEQMVLCIRVHLNAIQYSESSKMMSLLGLQGFVFCVQHAGLLGLKH